MCRVSECGWAFHLSRPRIGNVYVAGKESDNVFKITPAGLITEIIDAAGDGTSPFSFAQGIAVDGAGNVYVERA